MFPPRQEELLFTVEEERADQAASAAEKAMLQQQDDKDRQQYEMERLQRLEAKMQGKTQVVSKSFAGDEWDDLSPEEACGKWRKRALEREEELDIFKEKSTKLSEQKSELEKSVSQLKDKSIQDKRRYAKELTEQGKALVNMKEQVDSADSKAMIKRMVDMARQLSELTEKNKKLEESLEEQSAEHKRVVQGLRRTMLEVEAAALSKVEHANTETDEAQIEKVKALEQMDKAKADFEALQAFHEKEMKDAKALIEATQHQISELEIDQQKVSSQALQAEQRADVASVERDLALRGLATYRERHPTPTAELEIAETEHSSAVEALEHARAALDSMAIELAEAAVNASNKKIEKMRTTAQVGNHQVQSAWSSLLQSLPKRTKIKVLTKNAFRKVVNELHQEKVTTGSTSDKIPEPVFIQEFFHKRYGLEEIADTYLFGFLCSLQKYTPKEMGFDNPGIVYYLNRLRSEIDQALESRKCVIMPVTD